MQHMSVQVSNELAKEDDLETFNEVKWDDMMMRSMQILDTDYYNYMMIYSCQENVEYTDKSGTVEVVPEDVFTAYKHKQNKKQSPNGLYDPSNFENLKGIT